MRCAVRVQAADFDVGAEIEALGAGDGSVGAVVSFVGLCRDEAGRLAALELEHYPGMAETAIARIADAVGARWPVSALAVVHRYGRILPGERIVFVAAASPHRGAAFAAASFVMDRLKTDAPFWKKEHLRVGEGQWVAARDADAAAAGRWNT